MLASDASSALANLRMLGEAVSQEVFTSAELCWGLLCMGVFSRNVSLYAALPNTISTSVTGICMGVLPDTHDWGRTFLFTIHLTSLVAATPRHYHRDAGTTKKIDVGLDRSTVVQSWPQNPAHVPKRYQY